MQLPTPDRRRTTNGFAASETLRRYLLRRDAAPLAIRRGPVPFLAGNKTTLGQVSPLTGLPRYSFGGACTAAQLLDPGLDAIVPQSSATGEVGPPPYILVGGRAPDLNVTLHDAADLPRPQRSVCYWPVERELAGD